MMLFAAQFARLSSANGLGSWENWSIERQDGCIIKSCQLTLARYAAVCNMKVVDSLQHRTRRGSQLHLHLEVVSSLWQGMRRWFLFGQRPQRGDVLLTGLSYIAFLSTMHYQYNTFKYWDNTIQYQYNTISIEIVYNTLS